MRPLRLVVLMAACLGSGCALQGLLTRPAPLTREEQLDELIRTITANPDWLHAGHSPAVDKLVDFGDEAIPRLLDLMLLDGPYDGYIRLHAETALNYITLKKYGFVRGQGWTNPEGEERLNAGWKSLPRLDSGAPLAERERAVKLWREWVANGQPLPEK